MKRLPVLFCLAATVCLVVATPSMARETVSETFRVDPGGTLTLDTDRGKLEVRSWSRDEVSITIEVESRSGYSDEELLDMMDISMEAHGDDVEVEVDIPNIRGGLFSLFRNTGMNVTFEIVVPESYNLDLETSGGSITIDEIEGDVLCRTSGGSIKMNEIDGTVEARTSGGSVTLSRATGEANLQTSGGSITIGETGGAVTAKTSGGSIKIDRAGGQVHARTSGGSISVNEVAGAIDASTSGGSVTAHISRQPRDNCRLSTSGGGVTVYMNPDLSFDIDAQSSGGGVNTEMAVTFSGKISRNRLVASINGGGPELHLRSSGGGIRIRER